MRARENRRESNKEKSAIVVCEACLQAAAADENAEGALTLRLIYEYITLFFNVLTYPRYSENWIRLVFFVSFFHFVSFHSFLSNKKKKKKTKTEWRKCKMKNYSKRMKAKTKIKISKRTNEREHVVEGNCAKLYKEPRLRENIILFTIKESIHLVRFALHFMFIALFVCAFRGWEQERKMMEMVGSRHEQSGASEHMCKRERDCLDLILRESIRSVKSCSAHIHPATMHYYGCSFT